MVFERAKKEKLSLLPDRCLGICECDACAPFLLMPNGTHYHDLPVVPSVDLTETHHAIPMPGAAIEDAMRISITRDGKVYFRNHKVALDDLPDEIQEGLRNGAERKIYLAVDARAKYGDARAILGQIRLAGIENVSLLAEKP